MEKNMENNIMKNNYETTMEKKIIWKDELSC